MITIGSSVKALIDIESYDSNTFFKNETVLAGSVGKVTNMGYKRLNTGKELFGIAVQFKEGMIGFVDKKLLNIEEITE